MTSKTNNRVKPARLKISELFLSLQGEARSAGLPTVFVRLTGCPLRCTYCDTEYAFTGGEWYGLEALLENVLSYGVQQVCVTGGEPLSQANCLPFLRSLADHGLLVSLETSGALDISKVDARISRVMDLKTPASGEESKNRYENIEFLTQHDQLKFVLCDEMDYLWAKKQVEKYGLNQRCEVLFSPSAEQLSATQLADWIVRDRLNVRFQIQLHKYLWGDIAGV
ncbi:MAG: 7-carboxy-7-deazaguanine synthase QueE [Gammaproteobacteria bacterium]|nr:7-carboxy-7-deazaguanine synthase QueE [Gammaproteobacteria bacterium]